MAATHFVFCASFLILATQSNAKPSSRILGGIDAPPAVFQYAASLRLDNAHICGATIIGEKHVITAAHCVTENNSENPVDVRKLSVRVGSTNQYAGGKIIQIATIVLHPQYKDLKNDVAILVLDEKLVWTNKIQSIAYARTQSQEPPVDAKVSIAGWGENQDGEVPYKLQYTELTMASEEICTDAFQSNDDSIICLAHTKNKQGSCRGDAGNGAIYKNTLVGVSNFVIGACGSRYPDVYANLAHFATWVDSVLKQ